MTIKRLRELPKPDALRRMYDRPHDHRRWRDHELRVAATTQMAQWLAGQVASAADLSCGNGAILEGVYAKTKYYGDFAPSDDSSRLTGPIDQTVELIPKVDLFICSETVEHLDAPGDTLALIRPKTRMLVLSTPVSSWADSNPEHLWAWDREGVQQLLTGAGFKVVAYATTDARPSIRASYEFGIWGCV